MLTQRKENLENIEHNRPTTFKALQRETTVYKYYVELKEDALTEQGFFDLVKVPDLFVTGAAQFIKDLRRLKGLKRIDLIKNLNVSYSQVNHWENDRNIPLCSLVKVAEICGISRDIVYSFIDQGKFSLRHDRLPVKFEKIRDIIHYFSLNDDSNWQIYFIKCPEERFIFPRIKTILKTKSLSKGISGKHFCSKDLYNYLTTFFRYSKVSKIHFPLTNEVKLWYDNDVDLKRAVIIPCLQSDGSIVKYDNSLKFGGNSKILHDYFVDALYYEYDELPSSYFTRSDFDKCNVTKYTRKSTIEIIDEVMELAGNVKTSPAKGQTIEEYLKEPQPNLNYLLNSPEFEQKIALRIWASAEGHISAYRNQWGVYPSFTISCAHPKLAVQLQQISHRCNINLSIERSRDYWSGIASLRSSRISTCIEFLKFGGFIKGVKISAKSKYHKGISKDILMLGLLEIKKRFQTSQKIRNLSNQKLHEEINEIIKKREYNTADYYIKCFSEDDTMQ